MTDIRIARSELTVYVYNTINNKSYTREKFRGFCGFLMNHESFPTNTLSNGSTFNTDEAKPW